MNTSQPTKTLSNKSVVGLGIILAHPSCSQVPRVMKTYHIDYDATITDLIECGVADKNGNIHIPTATAIFNARLISELGYTLMPPQISQYIDIAKV